MFIPTPYELLLTIPIDEYEALLGQFIADIKKAQGRWQVAYQMCDGATARARISVPLPVVRINDFNSSQLILCLQDRLRRNSWTYAKYDRDKNEFSLGWAVMTE